MANLAADRVEVKIITGDNELVAQHVFAQLGLSVSGVITGAELQQMDDQALAARVEQVNLSSSSSAPVKIPSKADPTPGSSPAH